MTFGTSAANGLPAERMRIASNGNIGIGVTNPLQKLSVNGDFKLKESNAAWDSESGKCLYMRFWNNENAAYIQSIDRSNPTSKYITSYYLIYE
jgi:hypothetical protein